VFLNKKFCYVYVTSLNLQHGSLQVEDLVYVTNFFGN